MNDETSERYQRAGGDNMTREQATRHFSNRTIALKQEIAALSTPDKLRLAADFLDAMDRGRELPAGIPRSIVRIALAELESRR